MTLSDINIRDPFILNDNGKYYMYGTRAKDFGVHVGGFDVYVSSDLENWEEPVCCYDSEANGTNRQVNWAPEVHKHNGAFYMFATFTRECGLRGTFVLKASSPMGPFELTSNKPVTPEEWECLDGTLYFSKDGKPFLVFCHEHTQIIDGTICYLPLNDELTAAIGEPVTLFAGSEPHYVAKRPEGEHYVTDGPFMYRSSYDKLYMIWSTFIDGNYAECLVEFTDGELSTNFKHLEPINTKDGGHGMIFKSNDTLYFVFHSPNKTNFERPKLVKLTENKNGLAME